MFGGPLPALFLFWGYQLFIVLAASGYVLGVTQGREYAEPEWYVDLWLTVLWVLYLIIFVGTILKRREPHIYVSNWYYMAFIITIAVLHIGNNLAVPVSFFGVKSYSLFAGVQDAMAQWWYGHNAVGFFLTAGFLGMMYYFLPKQANRPIWSYRLSIINFWALIFLYIWAGPHHLHYTALPDWAQVMGMTFTIMLWMPSWGSAVNGMMTVSGAWDKLRTDPVLRLLVVSVAFYGMSTLEGPLMGVRQVNALSHYTDWTVGHVHSGALGWVGFITFGAIYYLVPRLWRRERLYSLQLVEWHFWIATLGIVLYITAMWVSGIMQGLMWRSYDQSRLPAILLRRDRGRDAPLLPDPRFRRRALPDRWPRSWPTMSGGRSGATSARSRRWRRPRRRSPRRPSRRRARRCSTASTARPSGGRCCSLSSSW